MSISFIYWLLLLLVLLFGLWTNYPFVGGYGSFGMNALQLILFGLIGWKIFGPPIHA